MIKWDDVLKRHEISKADLREYISAQTLVDAKVRPQSTVEEVNALVETYLATTYNAKGYEIHFYLNSKTPLSYGILVCPVGYYVKKDWWL